MKTSETSFKKILLNLLGDSWSKVWILLFLGILLTPTYIWAEDYCNTNIKVIDYSKYDYEAVCDFILARFQEVETELVDAQKQQVKLLLVSRLSDNDIIKKYEYTGKNSKVDFVVTDSKKLISKATLDFAKSHKSLSKEYVFARFGISDKYEDDAIEIGCDALSAQLFFDHIELKTVVIKSDFIN